MRYDLFISLLILVIIYSFATLSKPVKVQIDLIESIGVNGGVR